MRTIGLCSLFLTSTWLLAGGGDPGSVKPNPAPAGGSSAMQASGADSDPDRFTHLPRLVLDDTVHIVSAPWRWDRGDWTTVGVSVVAVIGTGLVLDRGADRFMTNHARPSWDRAAKDVENLGGTPSVLIAGGTYLAGVAFKDPEVRATGVDAMVTMGLAQVLVTLPLKLAVGRSRPAKDQGTTGFHPFNGGQSFPSGHTTQAFALASVIAEHADRPWVTGLSYGLACLVGLARVEQRQHFMSDVVAGALIGTFMGKAVVGYNQSLRTRARSKVAVSFVPVFQPGGYGLSMAMRF